MSPNSHSHSKLRTLHCEITCKLTQLSNPLCSDSCIHFCVQSLLFLAVLAVLLAVLLSVRVGETSRQAGMAEKYDDVKKFDTTKMSGAELKELGIEGARRPPGSGAGSTLHQQGGQGLGKAGRYPLILASVAGVVGIATFYYYRSLGVQDIPGKTNQALTSTHPATAKAPSER